MFSIGPWQLIIVGLLCSVVFLALFGGAVLFGMMLQRGRDRKNSN